MNNKPIAIVLCQVLTGFATARSIAINGVEVHAVSFTRHEPIHYSRLFKQVKLIGMKNDEAGIIDWLITYAKKIGNRPVVIPTSDVHALMLARNYKQLSPYCRLSTTSFKSLWNIISKGELYSLAKKAGVDIIPAIHEPDLTQLEEWTLNNEAPYFLKPFYESVDGCALTDKNLILPNRESLLAYASEYGTKALVIQRMINGGDGYIFDCYGMCNIDGQPITMASHRRWRQNPPNVGTTTYGEIPGHPEGNNESVLFDNTARLLSEIKHHGVFGIEWLQDKKANRLYLIDFNARPFSSIGHLTSAGLNLPYLTYAELAGEDISYQDARPVLKPSLWVDLLRDIQSLRERIQLKQITLSNWFRSLLRCSDYAYWDWKDPGPGMFRSLQITSIAMSFIWKRIKLW